MKPIACIAGALLAGSAFVACGARHTPLASYSTRGEHGTAEAVSANVATSSSVAPTTTVFANTEKPPIDVVLGNPTGDDDFKNSAAALGKEPPELTVDGWVGTASPILLRDLRDRAVVLVFCALADSRCDGAHRELLEIHNRYPDRKDLVIVEVFTDAAFDDADDKAIAEGISLHGFPWACGYGKTVEYARLRYGFPDIPAAYLIDTDGKVVWSGRIGVGKDTLPKALAVVMAEPP